MCKSQAEGGQRCAAHTRDAYRTADAALTEAQAAGDAAALAVATQRWDAAAAEYASTPTGHAELDQRRLQYQAHGHTAAASRLAAALRRGQTLREANTAAAAAIAQARTPEAHATSDDEALAAAFMAWQGDGPEPTSGYDDEGWLVDDHGLQWGYCNDCGEERQPGEECCEDGEVVPYRTA